MFSIRRFLAVLGFVTCLLVSSVSLNVAFAHSPNHSDVYVYDPFEGFNRSMNEFNMMFDRAVARPVIRGYRYAVPSVARKGISNAVRNLSEPVTFANALLQGDVEHGFRTFWRFLLNSTFGLAGTYEFAGHIGLHHRSEDFGQTLGHYGLGHGPYLVLPFLGPSSLRDTVGRTADRFAQPLNYSYIVDEQYDYALTTASTIDILDRTLEARENLDEISLDPYSSIRSFYIQQRANAVSNGGN